MLTVFRSPRLEPLADRLTAAVQRDLADPGHDPLQAVVVVVPGEGMRRWLRMHMAAALGICAGVRFPFVLTVLHEAFAAVLGKDRADLADERITRFTLAIAGALPGLVEQDVRFASLRDYLAAGSGDTQARRLALAGEIAAVFDRYVAYRPELVVAWERNETPVGDVPDWQPVLWRAISGRLGEANLALLAAGFAEGLAAGDPDWGDFPATLHVVAPAAVPPLHWEVLRRIADHREVCLYLVTPVLAETFPPTLPPLLATCGRLVLPSSAMLTQGAETITVTGQALPPTLLGWLQRGLLITDASPPTGPVALAPGDTSLQVLACHGRQRQVESLRDALLALLDRHPDLQPRDIAIMTPDPTGFAPLIEAVFADGADDPAIHPGGLARLPVTVADRSLQRENPVADALTAILGLAEGRLTVGEVGEAIALPAIREAFGASPDDVTALQSWLVDSGIAWGLDATDRAGHGQPAEATHTWQFGLNRLLLGYAMAGDGTERYHGVVPYEQISEGEAALLGRFAGFWRWLSAWVTSARIPVTLPVWADRCEALLARFGSADEDAEAAADGVRERLAELRTDAAQTGFAEAVSLSAFRQVLEARLRFAGSQATLLSGRITVCSLRSLRHVPARVVVLLGMDEDVFPSRVRRVSFDVMARQSRPGDRPADDEDRQLFLDAVLSARDHLIITYTGFDARSRAELPMSLPVAELVDTVIDGISAANGWPDDHPDRAALIERVLRPQPLQAFSPAVFGDGGDRPATAVPSYDRRLVAGARRLQARLRRGEQAAEPQPLLTGALPETGERVVSVDRLVSFWQEPLRGLLSGRLDLDLQDDDEDVPDREPVALSRLDEYRMGSLLVAWERLGVTESDMRALAMGTGMLPAGPQGGGMAIRLRQIATQLQQESAACGADGTPTSRYVDVTVGDLRVMGTVDRIWPTARIEARFGSLQAKHLLAAWIRHLVLQAAEPSARPTYVIGRKGDDILPPVVLPAIPQAVAFERLTVLLQGWQLGQTRPLLFFPKTSLAYVEAYRKAVAKGEVDPAAVARTKVWGTWTGFFNGRISPHSEAQSAYVQHLLGSGIHAVWDPDFEVPGYAEALPAFAELARLVWMPYLEDGNGTV